MAGRVVWHVNSTAAGGGVAEMLSTLLAYTRGAGVDVRWLVISGDDPEFFEITKRIHNNLHGSEGDGGPLGTRRSESRYERIAEVNAAELEPLIRPEDIVYLHDPQPAGLAPKPQSTPGPTSCGGATSGSTTPNEIARRAWAFLNPYVVAADHYRLLERGLRLGRPRPIQDVDGPPLHRPVLTEERAHGTRLSSRAILARTGIVEDGGIRPRVPPRGRQPRPGRPPRRDDPGRADQPRPTRS